MNGSSRNPANTVETMKPTIIVSHVNAAAPPRRSGATDSASNARNGVPVIDTPTPIAKNASTLSTRPSAKCVAITIVAAAAPVAPAPKIAMPPKIHGVRRPERSDPKPV